MKLRCTELGLDSLDYGFPRNMHSDSLFLRPIDPLGGYQGVVKVKKLDLAASERIVTNRTMALRADRATKMDIRLRFLVILA